MIPQTCPKGVREGLHAEPFLRLVRAVPTPLKLSTFGGVRDTTSCTRVHAEQESQLNGGSVATFAYSGQFGKISHRHPVKFQICIQIRVVKNGVRFCVKIWNDL